MDGQIFSQRGQREQQGATGHVELQAGRRHGGVVLTVTWKMDGVQFYQNSHTRILGCQQGYSVVLKLHLYHFSVYTVYA